MSIFRKLFGKDKEKGEMQKEQEEVLNEAEEQASKPIEEEEPEEWDKAEEAMEENLEPENYKEQIEKDRGAEEGDLEKDVEQEMPVVEESLTETKSKKAGFFTKLVEGLGKTRNNIMQGVEQVFKSFTKIDEELFEELEEVLIMADIGVETTMKIMEALRQRVKKEKVSEVSALRQMLIQEISILMEDGSETIQELKTPTVILVIGVNGVGKTTTIGKLAHNFQQERKKVLLAAADTFRAAAIDQLEVWGKRAGVDVIKHQENSDPAAVVFDAVQAAKARKTDILICDTAGRLHNKKNLMEELRKISRVIEREYPEAHKEVFLVLDATTGQNALQQAKLFKEVADISGIVLTKLDGTAKGGIVIAIKSELHIPVRFVGIGEGAQDIQPFYPEDFAKALFAEE